MTAQVIDEPRRWAAFHCHGIYSLLMSIQGSYEDIEGALVSGQLEMAKHSARRIALLCLRSRALLADGLPDDEGDVFANPFAGLDEGVVTAALDAARAVTGATSVAEARAGSVRVHDLITALVESLGFDSAPPSIRTPSGLFPALRLAREMLPVNRSAGLPLVFPPSWTATGKGVDRG